MNGRVYSVEQINRYVKQLFVRDGILTSCAVSGEVTNLKYHSSGHIYFSLKDRSGTLSCVMFAGHRRGLSFVMKEGDKVIVSGSVDVYERDGRYQLYARRIEQTGEGALYAQFLALKEELEECGYFDPEIKRPIPKYAMHIGIVTAPTGAAIRDIQNIAKRRNPYVQLTLAPVQVQGNGAKESIVRGIQLLDGRVDVIIVGRGGGSYEDLWAFNERIVADAINECGTPVISAVGHETDTTIADYVADLRAPTPSAAAEIAVFDYARFKADLAGYTAALTNRVAEKYRYAEKKLQWNEARFKALSPSIRADSAKRKIMDYSARMDSLMLDYLERDKQRAALLGDRMNAAAAAVLKERRDLRLKYGGRLQTGMREVLRTKEHALAVAAERWQGMNPLKSLSRGYTFTVDSHDRALTSVTQVEAGDPLRLYVRDGLIQARVKSVSEMKPLGG